MIVFGKVTHDIFHSQDGMYHVFNIRRHGGQFLVATYVGDDPPKPMKTVEYEFRGDEIDHSKYGKQLSVTTYRRSTVKGEPKSINRKLKKFEQDMLQHMKDL